ncbi:trypsin-like peptidase domain-containing protein [Bradyrhizobium sp. USDA 223]|uniref:trypsin-like peptidase domain-containing protein n=1 Tax=Bradyrhizobium sp. USDA 223 TaxID=3156306 RepID=UPI003832647C
MSSSEKPSGGGSHLGQSAIGLVTSDPLGDLPVGASITFNPIVFGGSNADVRPLSVNNWGAFEGAIFSVVLKSASSSSVLGSAFMIAPGIAITASHLFSDILDDLQKGEVVPYCLGIRGTTVEIWTVTKLSYGVDDTTILSIAPASSLPKDGKYYRMSLTTRAPKNGEKLHIAGFRAETLSHGPNPTFSGHMYTSVGTVAAVHPNGRDRVLMPYPVIELNCGSLGGMSGGAAIDEQGFVMGIVSRGFETADGDGPTYVSWIINAMARQLEVAWPPGAYRAPVSLLSLDDHTIVIEGREALAGTTEKAMVYKPWFE